LIEKHVKIEDKARALSRSCQNRKKVAFSNIEHGINRRETDE